ncbi:STAS domain-containing protein [Streptomyces odontomachi]|uniref:STAS domain-containing protein n=1 Tax=Streptomyces odontomachi TaxID=2944940 RepID=UPI00210E7E26|nr:STAS domain-containing protein [Streptomyces sp. ODS25]
MQRAEVDRFPVGESASGSVGAQYAAGPAWVVEARGDMDLHGIEPLATALTHAAETHSLVVLDASGVSFGDSAFLNLLLRVQQSTTLRLAALPAQLRRMLQISGADAVLNIHPTVADATAAG